MKSKITAIAITHNNEKIVKKHIESLLFADEVIFVDCNSSDKTVEIAASLGVHVLARTSETISKQLNSILERCKNNWISFFDIYHIISPETISELQFISENSKENATFSIQEKQFFMQKQMRFGGWKSKNQVVLFNKKNTAFEGETYPKIALSNLKNTVLKTAVVYNDYTDFDSYNQHLTNQSKLEAIALYKKNIRPNQFNFLILPFSKFFNHYFLQLGFLDGKEGFILCYCKSFQVLKKQLHLWLLYRKMD